jgi:hypothetical protein
MSQPREVRLVLFADGTRRLVPLDELNEAALFPPSVGSEQQRTAPAESPPLEGSVRSQVEQGIRPGDIVTTPFGEGTVVAVNPSGGAPYQVDIPGKSTYFLGPSEVSLAPPKEKV